MNVNSNIIAFPKAQKPQNDEFSNLHRSPELLLCMAMLKAMTDEQKIEVFLTCSEAKDIFTDDDATQDAFGIAQKLCGQVAVA